MSDMNYKKMEERALRIGSQYEELDGWFTDACEALAKATVEQFTDTVPEAGTAEHKIRQDYLVYSLWLCNRFFPLRSALRDDDVLVHHDCEEMGTGWVLELTPAAINKYANIVEALYEERIEQFRNVEVTYLNVKFEESN